ncbi:MAG: hypothetical protein QNJ81_13540 [Acidimicrobiia bacterium]|nr:hypothetical protein [Acidimicrobiia bacterium]
MDRSETLRDSLRAALDATGEGRTPLDALEDLETLDEFVADYSQARVDDARAAGASWAEIADKLGVTRQAAHKRFGGKKPRKASLELRLIWDKKR